MVQTILFTLFQVILPLSIPVLIGALLVRFKQVDIKPLLTFALYYLTPAIVFDTLLTARISHTEIYQTLDFALLNLVFLWAIAAVLGKLLKFNSSDAAGVTLVSSFTNSVNYGLPLVLLAFGKLGLDKASVYVVIQLVIMNTIGVFFAARSQFSIKKAFKSIFSLPAVYAAAAALFLRVTGLQLPGGIVKGISMIADGYSPIVLAILGGQMMSVKIVRTAPKEDLPFWTGMFVRVFLSPLVALLSLFILHIEGILHSVLFVLASMPVAVNAVILAEEYNASPKLVSKSILWTTLLSFIVLPLLLVMVK